MAAEIEPEDTPEPRRRSPWRALFIVWAMLLLLLGGGATVLQVLGPLPAVEQHAAAPAEPAPVPPAEPAPAPPPAAAAVPAATVRQAGAPIGEPDPALQAPGPYVADTTLPRIGPDGRKPWLVYAAGWDHADRSPRVAVLLAGMGLAGADDTEAMHLPPTVSFALSPYASHPDRSAAAARAAGHEVLMGIPLEPQGYPLNDPGPLALLTGQPAALNSERLEQVLGLAAGYVGITNTIGSMRGERFSSTEQMNDVLREAASRGLLFLDARPGAALPVLPGLVARAADLLLDQPPVGREIDLQLAKLVGVAKARGSAIGVAGAPTPVTVLHLAEWATSLARQGVVLVPVSALMQDAGAKQ